MIFLCCYSNVLKCYLLEPPERGVIAEGLIGLMMKCGFEHHCTLLPKAVPS